MLSVVGVVGEHVEELPEVPVVHLLGRAPMEHDGPLGRTEGLVEGEVERLRRQDRGALGGAGPPAAAALAGERLRVLAVTQVALGSATLSWVAPTQREDGTALVNLAGYRIKYGTSSGSFPNQVQISNPGITSCVIENLPAGTYYFVATAYDSNGNESGPSAVISKTIT